MNVFLKDFNSLVQRRSWIFLFIVSSWNLLIQNERIWKTFQLISCPLQQLAPTRFASSCQSTRSHSYDEQEIVKSSKIILNSFLHNVKSVQRYFKKLAVFSSQDFKSIFSHFSTFCIQGLKTSHCVKTIRIQSFSGPYFPALGLNTVRYRV